MALLEAYSIGLLELNKKENIVFPILETIYRILLRRILNVEKIYHDCFVQIRMSI